MSIASFSPALERAHHQEVSLSQRMGKTKIQAAFYSDRVSNTVLTGVGGVADSGELLPDVDSGTFSYQGRDLDTSGLRLVLQRKVAADLTATLDYGYGGVLDLTRPDVQLQEARQSLSTVRRHAVSGKLSGHVPGCKTRWTTSYGWVSGQALTPVDMFNVSPGQSDPFLNVFRTAAAAGVCVPADSHGSDAGPAQSDGAGLCAGDGSGWTYGVPGAAGALGARWRGVYVLGRKQIWISRARLRAGLFVVWSA